MGKDGIQTDEAPTSDTPVTSQTLLVFQEAKWKMKIRKSLGRKLRNMKKYIKKW